jgi:hypothetical protein
MAGALVSGDGDDTAGFAIFAAAPKLPVGVPRNKTSASNPHAVAEINRFILRSQGGTGFLEIYLLPAFQGNYLVTQRLRATFNSENEIILARREMN